MLLHTLQCTEQSSKKASSSPGISNATVEKMLPSGMNSGLLFQIIGVSNNISKARVWDPWDILYT